jgi:hypothetical protein
VEDNEESIHFAGSFQKWSRRALLVLFLGLVTAFVFMDRGQYRNSVLALVLFFAILQLVLMEWIGPIVRRFHKDEFERWFRGHMKSYGWLAAFSLVPFLLEL